MPEATESPVDPKSTPSYRVALGIVIGLGVLILVGVVVLFIGLAQGWGKKPAPPAPKAKVPVSLGIEPGYRILSSDTQPGRLIIHVRSSANDEIYIIDTEDGHIVATIKADAPP